MNGSSPPMGKLQWDTVSSCYTCQVAATDILIDVDLLEKCKLSSPLGNNPGGRVWQILGNSMIHRLCQPDEIRIIGDLSRAGGISNVRLLTTGFTMLQPTGRTWRLMGCIGTFIDRDQIKSTFLNGCAIECESLPVPPKVILMGESGEDIGYARYSRWIC
ncbi:hypothetical protein KM043_016830 [Ampulex compressa]|nr:hypothetical protein KM043_016830 [Ampulex compressa]